MKVKVATSAGPHAEMLCMFVFSGDRAPLGFHEQENDPLTSDVLQSTGDMAGSEGEEKEGRITVIPVSSQDPARRILLAGLGSRKDFTDDAIRHVSGRIAKKARELRLAGFSIVMPSRSDLPSEAGAEGDNLQVSKAGGGEQPLRQDGRPPARVAQLIVEGAKMSMYRFNRFKSNGGGNGDGNCGYGDGGADDADGDGAHDPSEAVSDGGTSNSGRPYRRADSAAAGTPPILASDILHPKETGRPDPDLTLVCTEPEYAVQVAESAETAAITSDGNTFVRSVANLPPNECTPKVLAEIACGIARETAGDSDAGGRIKCTIISKNRLRKDGFGGITAVGQGSKNKPRLIILEYTGRGKGKKKKPAAPGDDTGPIVLVGKAVTFDTGGISLKPGGSMDEMKFDKCGGCTVLGIVRTAAALNVKTDIVGIIPAVENMPGGGSYRPGDIIRLYSGKTAEILNTDAEGRLILADAISYAEEQYSPREIIDFATLTGACIVALGNNVAGMTSNDPSLADSIKESAGHTAEAVWELPLNRDYMDMIKSQVADMRNIGIGRAAGTITAAAFLKNAILKNTPWVHLDIAGVAWTQTATKARSYKSKGATGFGLRLIVDHLLKMDNASSRRRS